jgi:hypothetical protein
MIVQNSIQRNFAKLNIFISHEHCAQACAAGTHQQHKQHEQG